MESDLHYYEGALRRIYRSAAVLTVAGAVLCAWLYGVSGLAGFALGALAAWVTMRTLRKLVDSLAQAENKRPRKRVAVFLGLRYLLIGAGGYAIIKAFGANAIALVLGLSVMVAAVMIEVLYELIYART